MNISTESVLHMTDSIPNLFIVGAAKSGTTSLWQYLKRHPSIFMPEDELHKEPCFFSKYGESMGIDNYLKIFSGASRFHKLVGEASTAHLTDPVSAQRIFNFNPNAKIIIILRNPAVRAYSLYNWMVQDGYEYASTFQEALDLEERRSALTIPNWYEPQYYWNYMYFRSGMYYEQVKRYLDLFGSNVMVLKFEDLKSDPDKQMKSLCAFLNIEPYVSDYQEHNVSHEVISAKIQFLMRHVNTHIINMLDQKTDPFQLSLSCVQYYRACVNKLSEVTHVSWPDRMSGGIHMGRVLMLIMRGRVYKQKDIISKIQRDTILQIGHRMVKPAMLSVARKHDMITKYSSDIEKLTSLTKVDFSRWLDAT